MSTANYDYINMNDIIYLYICVHDKNNVYILYKTVHVELNVQCPDAACRNRFVTLSIGYY